MKATFLGQAAVYLETDKTKIIIDPFLTGNPKATAKADDLDPDYIVLTHGHSDHVGDTLPIAKRTGAKVIATFELAFWLGDQGVTVSAQDHGGWCKYPFGAVKFTQAMSQSTSHYCRSGSLW
jgi:L-ascorbate metabolism protein UlaG (beta-lactamase superfamily)